MFHDSPEEHTLKSILEVLECISAQLRDENAILRAVEAEQIASKQLLQDIVNNTNKPPSHFTLKGALLTMANPIPAGSTGQLGWTLQDNGVNDTTGFVLTPTYTADDSAVTFAPATTDASGGTIPLTAQTVVSVPAGDANTTVTITASSPAPDGSTATGTLTIAVTPVAQKFTLVGTQLLP
jgi:hypothetical protein